MAKLNSTEIIGTTSVSNPPANNACIWYDSSSKKLKFTFYGYGAGTWSTGGALSSARSNLGGAGTQNAGLAFGGSLTTNATEEYNGASWSAGGALNVARDNLRGAGTQNAGLAFGGYSNTTVACTEEYNGSLWSVGGVLATRRTSFGGAGTQNAGLAFGGSLVGGPSYYSCTEEYNGTSWSTGGSLMEGRNSLAGAGTQNAGLAIGGTLCQDYNAVIRISGTEEYNGATWSKGGSLNHTVQFASGIGTQNEGLATAFNTTDGAISNGISTLRCTEEYNGAVWSTGGTLNAVRRSAAGAGTQSEGLLFGGYLQPSRLSCTEEYNKSLGYITCILS